MDFLKRFAALVFEHGRQEGMKQERALWTLTKVGQEIEAQRPWAGLTEGEITNALKKYQGWREFAAELDAILERKNAAGSQAFYGFPTEPVSTPNAGGKCVTAGETAPTHTLNSTKTVAVATDTYWLPIDKDTPRSVKLQLLSIGGVAQYGTLGSDVSFYTHWSPLPKKPK